MINAALALARAAYESEVRLAGSLKRQMMFETDRWKLGNLYRARDVAQTHAEELRLAILRALGHA